MWNLSDRPKVRRTAGRSVSMQPAVTGSESVTHPAIRHPLAQQRLELGNRWTLEVPLVAEHPIARRLRNLVLLHLGSPKYLLPLRVPPQVDVVQLLRVGKKDDLGR